MEPLTNQNLHNGFYITIALVSCLLSTYPSAFWLSKTNENKQKNKEIMRLYKNGLEKQVFYLFKNKFIGTTLQGQEFLHIHSSLYKRIPRIMHQN